MTEPFEHAPPTAPGADPTRDIRLPSLPGRPAPALPAGWASPATEAASEPVEKPAGAEPSAPAPRLLNQPTDRLEQPGSPRKPTLAFSSPEMVHRPVAPVQVGRSPRRWPWVVLVALPVLIIVGTGIWLLLLLRAA